MLEVLGKKHQHHYEYSHLHHGVMLTTRVFVCTQCGSKKRVME